MMDLTYLETALKKGATLHGFRSGGGLRVFRIDLDGDNIGYGEHPAALDALAHVNLWLEQDPAPTYQEFYGGKFPHYLTGSTHSSDDLDAWLKKGSTVDARCEGDKVVVELHGYVDVSIPDEIQERVHNGEQLVKWEHRGYRFHITPIKFANGERGCSMETVFVPEGKKQHNSTFYRMVKIGKGADFFAAVDAAFEAEEQETDD